MVDGDIGTTATYIQGGEKISISIPEAESPKKKLIFELKVLYEDDYLAVVHKPAGILVSGNRFKTVANALPQNLKESPLEDACKPQPVHRLDFATTGILLVGKTSSSIRLLNKLFENKETQKTYIAVTIGEMNPQGTITSSIDDKSAHTEYIVCESVDSLKYGKLNLVKLIPHTGRRHQLRKHLAEIGNPILGDKDYGNPELITKGTGLCLHAYSLRFIHPFTEEKIHITDKLPNRFSRIFPSKNTLLFDGICNLCNRTVQFIIQRDPQRKFKFASLQSERGQTILEQYGLSTNDIDTVVFIHGDKVYLRSSAVLRVLKELGGIWKVLYICIIIPQPIRDALYNYIARTRYKTFGKRATCMIPTPEIKDRFLD